MDSEFFKPENVYLIWELLSEQNIIKNQSNQVKEEISNYVVSEIHNFYKNILKNKLRLSLIDLNKEYIKFIVLYVKTNFSNQINQINKIKIHDEPITFEAIQEQRELEFNTKFNEMQNDFTSMVTIKKPDTPQFEDIIEDQHISVNEMEEKLKEMTSKRNYDFQVFETKNQKNTNNNSTNDNNNINNNNINNKKSVSFEISNLEDTTNEATKNKTKDTNVTNDFISFFTNLDTYEEPIYNHIPENDNYNLQKQINELKDKLSSFEAKLDLIISKI